MSAEDLTPARAADVTDELTQPRPVRNQATLRHEWQLPSVPASLRSVRAGLRAILDDTGLPEDRLHDLLLAACEAAANAVEHAQDPTEPFFHVIFEVTEDHVAITIRDHGRWRDGPSAGGRGRGLQMMRVLAEMSVVPEPQGTTVTLRSVPGDGRPTAPDPRSDDRPD